VAAAPPAAAASPVAAALSARPGPLAAASEADLDGPANEAARNAVANGLDIDERIRGTRRDGRCCRAQTFDVAATAARYVRLEGTNLRQNPNDSNAYRMQFAEIGAY
jgi:hypothetical protein